MTGNGAIFTQKNRASGLRSTLHGAIDSGLCCYLMLSFIAFDKLDHPIDRKRITVRLFNYWNKKFSILKRAGIYFTSQNIKKMKNSAKKGLAAERVTGSVVKLWSEFSWCMVLRKYVNWILTAKWAKKITLIQSLPSLIIICYEGLSSG